MTKQHYRYKNPDDELTEPQEILLADHIYVKSYQTGDEYEGEPFFTVDENGVGEVYLDNKLIAGYSGMKDAGEVVEKFNRHFMIHV